MPPLVTVESEVRQRTLLGAETVRGTAVTPDTELLDLKFEPTAEGESSQHAAAGSIVDTVNIPNKEWAVGKFSGAIGYNSLSYILDSAWGAGASGVWAPAAFAPITRKTYTLYRGTSTAAYAYAGAQVNGLRFHLDHDGTTLEGDLFATGEIPGASMPTDPTEIAVSPIKPAKIGLWTASTFAGTYARFSTIGLMVDVDMSNLEAPVWGLDDTYGTSYIGTVEQKPALTCKIVLLAKVSGSDHAGPFTKAAFEAATPLFVRVKAADGSNLFQMDMCLKLLKPPVVRPGPSGMMVLEAECGFFFDSTSEKWIEITDTTS